MRPDSAAGAGDDRRHERLRTSCGRVLTIGRLALGDVRRPAARVFVDLGECSGCEGNAWAGLTVAEARQFARAVLAQATAAERECPVSTASSGTEAAADPRFPRGGLSVNIRRRG
jgi:hypothetical protein